MRTPLQPLLILMLLFGAGCTDVYDGPTYIETDYQVRCVRCEPRAPNSTVRRIAALDGDDGLEVSCRADAKGGDRLIFMEVKFDAENDADDYGLEFTNLNIDADDLGANCQVTIQDGRSVYQGNCTKDDPTEEAPCQVLLEVDGEDFSGTVFCAGVDGRDAMELERHLTAPGEDDVPVDLQVANCIGL